MGGTFLAARWDYDVMHEEGLLDQQKSINQCVFGCLRLSTRLERVAILLRHYKVFSKPLLHLLDHNYYV